MILEAWKKCQRIPFGKALFNRSFGFYVPYSGSIHPKVESLEPGHAIVSIHDRRKLRNHLGSIHAAALMNLLEATSGLAFISSLPKNMMAIVVKFEVEYLKKARGKLTGECRCESPSPKEEKNYQIEAQIRNETGDLVARGRATWRVRPVEKL